MQFPVKHIFIWRPKLVDFDNPLVRERLSDFMELEDNYYKVMEDCGDVVDLNRIDFDEGFADSVFFKLRPTLKDEFIVFLKKGI